MCRDSLKHCCRCAICTALPTVQSIVSIDQTLGKGEPTMRSPWTNPTIIRRPSIAALAAAALLVACDQPAGPSQPGGRILADAQAGTISARGAGVVEGSSCDVTVTTCNLVGRGLKFGFAFSGDNTSTPAVPVTGTFTASDPLTNVQIQYTGVAFVVPSVHEVHTIIGLPGSCYLTTPDGTTLFTFCQLCAFDGASNGAIDKIGFEAHAANGNITTFGGFVAGSCPTDPLGELASGNINID